MVNIDWDFVLSDSMSHKEKNRYLLNSQYSTLEFLIHSTFSFICFLNSFTVIGIWNFCSKTILKNMYSWMFFLCACKNDHSYFNSMILNVFIAYLLTRAYFLSFCIITKSSVGFVKFCHKPPLVTLSKITNGYKFCYKFVKKQKLRFVLS